MSDHKHIPGKPVVPPEEDILSYLNKDMAEAEQHDFERAADDDPFVHDAMEGLESLHPKTNLSLLAEQLNSDFRKQLDKKKKRRAKRKYKDQTWIYFAIVMVVLLMLAAFIVMRQFG